MASKLADESVRERVIVTLTRRQCTMVLRLMDDIDSVTTDDSVRRDALNISKKLEAALAVREKR